MFFSCLASKFPVWVNENSKTGMEWSGGTPEHKIKEWNGNKLLQLLRRTNGKKNPP